MSRDSGRFASPVPEIEEPIKASMNMVGILKDLDKLEYMESRHHDVLRAITAREREIIREFEAQLKDLNRGMERLKKREKVYRAALDEEEI